MTLQEFADKVTQTGQESLRKAGMGCEANLRNAIARVKQGRKWAYVDVGCSGKYMVNPQGEIYGIKGYGVPHLGHYFGTLENPSPKCFVGRWG